MFVRFVFLSSTLLMSVGMFAAERLDTRATARAATSEGRAVTANPVRDRIFSYVYDGNGWSTTFVLTNLDNHPINLGLLFTADDGSNLQFPVQGVGTTSAINITLTPGGTISLPTANIASNRSSGYAFVQVPNGTDRFAGYAVVRQQSNNQPDNEFTEPLTPLDENQFVLPMDNTNGFTTFVALVNSSTQNNSTTNITVQDQNGNVLATDQVQITPLGRATFNVNDRYPQLANQVGSILFSSDRSQFVTGIGLRSGPNGSLTAVPPFSLPLP